MKVLLDTCTFLWLTTADRKLSLAARDVFESAENQVVLSCVSAWEIGLKHSLGKLVLPYPAWQFVPEARSKHGIEHLALDEESALHASRLPRLHADPFDRLLVAQALVHGLVIVTPDPAITQYPVRVLWQGSRV